MVSAGAVSMAQSLIPQNGWSVVYVDSQETICGNGVASNAIDGNPSTMWHTQFCPTTAPLPHEIQIDLGAYYSLSAFQYLPRQDGSACGWINQYEFYVSTDGVNWGTPVAAGNFDYTGYTPKCPGPGAGIPTPRQIGFPATLGRFIRLRALSEITGKPYTSAAEINVVGTASVLPPVTVSQLILNPTTVLAGSASSATVTLTAPALSGGAVVTLSSSNPAVAAVPASLSFPPGVSSGEFLISASAVGASTTVTINASYGGTTQGAILTVTPLIPQDGWSVVYVDSQETICGNGVASNAIDGNPSTMWHTQFCPTTAPLPHEIQIDLGAYYSLSAFQYLPRQDGSACGWINQYEFYVSTDGVNWGTPVAAGNFDYTGYTPKCPGPGAGIPTPRQIGFPATLGRFIRLRALSEITGKPYTSAAEINVVGTASVLPPVTVSQLILNPTTVLAGSASSATVTLTAPALSGGAVVTLSSSNPAVAAVPASLSFPPGVSSGEFLISASLVSTSTSASILASYGGVTQSATITVIPGTLIPQNGWAVVYADSQETICGNGVASNAIDGNSSTMWHTQFCPTTAALPHEIQIDLGASYTLSAFQYLPRQDGSACGWIKQYEFYVSPDGINWGTPVAAGTFDYTGYTPKCPGPGAGIPTPRQIGFPAATGRYIRLRALSEMNGNPYTSAAEIKVLNIQLAPLALAVNPTSVPGGSVSTGTVTLAAPAPAGGAVVTLTSTNPALATVPASLTIPEGTDNGNFPVSTSAVSASTTVDILASYGGVTQGSTLALSPLSLIPHNGWLVVYADSQETVCGNGVASNAIDGNSSTMWHTQFCPTTVPLPHEIQIDLGAYYTLSAFQYLPRQDGSACGWINQYEFYVSTDGVNWGTPVAAGNFDYTGFLTKCPGPGAGLPTPRQIGFPPTVGRYIRLRALSEVNGNPWTSAAEIDVLGDLQPGLSPSAGSLDFPDQLLNTSSTPLPLVLTNVGLGTVGITGIGAFGDFTQTNNCAASLPALASCTITVTFTPKVLGYRSARLTVLNSATGQLEIPLSGNGVMPIASLSSASVVFGPQMLNSTGTAPSIGMLNVGSAPLVVSNVTVTGDFGQTNNCAGGIAVSAGCTIQVSFTPTALGTRSGTITVFDNTSVGSHSISMSGVGVPRHNVNLSWTASTSPVIGYFVYRATQSGGPYTELNSLPQAQTTFIDSLPGGATYYYVVTAVDANLVESVTTPEIAATIPQP